MRSTGRRPHVHIGGALVTALLLVLAACGGGNDTTSAGEDPGADDAGAPTPGGAVVYGTEAAINEGLCLPETTAPISSLLAIQSLYDPLVYPNEDGELVPFLAESVTSNDDATEWTITLRDGISFHDGTPLDAQALKRNLDTFRNVDTELVPLLSSIVFQEVTAVEVTGPRSVVVTTERPWVSFPAYLFLSGRIAISAPAQLADRDTCAREPIGTGPFRLAGSWTPGAPLELERNPDYWRTDEDGTPLPYLDRLTLTGVTEQTQRLNQLQGGSLQIVHTPFQSDVNELAGRAERGEVNLFVAETNREVRYYMMNAGRPPFDDPEAREAFTLAVDVAEIDQLRNQGEADLADGPFDVGVMGHLDDLPSPVPDPDRAEELVESVRERTGSFSVQIVRNPDTNNEAEAALIAEDLRAVGIDVTIEQVDQTVEIDRALAGAYDVMLWRLHPGEDPDTQYLFWHSTYPTNFNHLADEELDRLLDEGRTTADPAARRAAYEAVNRRFAEQRYNQWAWYVNWGVATQPNVHGILGPTLPDGSTPAPLLGGVHPTAGIWVEQ